MDLNLIYLVYGLAYFSMGIVVWVRIKPLVDNRIATVFRWLAAFGVIHGIHVLIEMFVIMGHTAVTVLYVSTLFVALSFAALLQFGIELIGITKKRSRIIHLVPAILFFLWFLFYLGTLFYDEGVRLAYILSMYTLGLPGTLLTAYSLIRKRKEIAENPRITEKLFLAGVFFAFYGVLSVIVPESDFFPASILNYSWFSGLVGLPIQLFNTIFTVAITYFIVMSLNVFDVLEKRMLSEQLEKKTNILKESEKRFRTLAETAADAIIII